MVSPKEKLRIRKSHQFQEFILKNYIKTKNCREVARIATAFYQFSVTYDNVLKRVKEAGLKSTSDKPYHSCPSMYDNQRGIKR